MSEETVKYETGKEVTYKTPNDIFEEFLARTGIDPINICEWSLVAYTDTLLITLTAGGKIVYTSE